MPASRIPALRAGASALDTGEPVPAARIPAPRARTALLDTDAPVPVARIPVLRARASALDASVSVLGCTSVLAPGTPVLRARMPGLITGHEVRMSALGRESALPVGVGLAGTDAGAAASRGRVVVDWLAVPLMVTMLLAPRHANIREVPQFRPGDPEPHAADTLVRRTPCVILPPGL